MGFTDKITAWLETFGPFGLFMAAGLDSFVPLGHVVDPTVMILSHTHQDPIQFAAIAVAGSVIGTTILFLLVRAFGDAFVNKRLKPETRARMESLLQRYGLLLVIIGGIMPPPFPFKAVVLVSGLTHMRLVTFVAGVLVARTFRYGLESILAVLYGDWALMFMREHYPLVGVAAIALTVGVWLFARRMMRAAPAPAPAE